MQVVILAGGMGVRMRGYAPSLPKALIPINDRPFIHYQMSLLGESGMKDILICIGHLGPLIEEYVEDGSRWNVNVRYSREDPVQLLGTGGAVVNAIPMLENIFFTLYGDSYLPIDYSKIVSAFKRDSDDAMMSVFRNEGRWDTSNVRVKHGMVDFYSKTALSSQVDHIDYGMTGFHRHQIEAYLGATMPLDLSQIQDELVRQGRMRAFEVRERFYEIGKPKGLAELEVFLKRH